MNKRLNTLLASSLMPKDEKTLNELIKRADILSLNEVKNIQETILPNYIRFRLGKNEFYGIPYEKISEVMRHFILTPVPNLPSFIAGVINLRGTLTSVINLKIFFHIPHEATSDHPQIIVVNSKSMVAGLLVDNIEGNEVYDPLSLDLPIASQGIAPELIIGINQGTTAIINIDKILDDFKENTII